MTRFKKGKVIIHPTHGACKVQESLPTKLILTSCLQGFNSLTIIIPLKSLAQIKLRPLSSKKTIREALAKLKARFRHQELKYSEEGIKDRFVDGDLNGLCQAVGQLYYNIYTDGDERASQMKLLSGAINLMAEEVGIVQQIEKEKAKQGILTRLQQTFGP